VPTFYHVQLKIYLYIDIDKMRLLLVLLLLSMGVADHFSLVAPDGPPLISSDPSARLAGRMDAAIWSTQNKDVYVYGGLTANGPVRDFWKFEAQTRRWIWFPDGPGPQGRYASLYQRLSFFVIF
jgi:Galactose oxidase, central domain